MAGIRDYVQLNIPETYRVLVDKGNLDGQGSNPDLVGAQVDSVLSRLFPGVDPGEKEQELSESSKSYVGDVVTRMVIPAGIDYWQVQSRRQDGIQLPAGFTPGGGETGVNYDRVQGLLSIDVLLAGRIASLTASFLDEQDSGPTPSPAFGVSSSRDDLLTEDPFTAWSKTNAGRFLVRFGVPIVVREG